MKRQWILWGVLILLMLAGVAFGQVDRSGEVATLKQGLESTSRSARIDAAKRITQAGLTDGVLYDKVAALLQAGYGEAVEANAVDEMAWLCKALAASGDTRHQPLLEEVATLAPNVKLQKYARQSIDPKNGGWLISSWCWKAL